MVLLLGTMVALPPKPVHAMSLPPKPTHAMSDSGTPTLHKADFYPDQHPEVTTVDGNAYSNPVAHGPWPPDEWPSWSDIHNGPGTDVEDESTALWVFINAGPYGINDPPYYKDTLKAISRVITLFDTSIIPADAEIIEATLFCVVLSKYEIAQWPDFSLVVVSSNPASNTAIMPADYQCLGSTALSNVIPISTIPVTPTEKIGITFTLNAEGVAAINKGGHNQTRYKGVCL